MRVLIYVQLLLRHRANSDVNSAADCLVGIQDRDAWASPLSGREGAKRLVDTNCGWTQAAGIDSTVRSVFGRPEE